VLTHSCIVHPYTTFPQCTGALRFFVGLSGPSLPGSVSHFTAKVGWQFGTPEIPAGDLDAPVEEMLVILCCVKMLSFSSGSSKGKGTELVLDVLLGYAWVCATAELGEDNWKG